MVSGAKQPFLHPKAFYSWLYAGVKVSPSAGLPVRKPFISQRERWSEVPWLKVSGVA